MASPRAAAERAAKTARVTVEPVTDAAGAAVIGRIFDLIWHTGGPPVMPDEVLRMYALTGQYLALAADLDHPDRTPIAASLGVFAAPSGRGLHSHITGVLPAGMGRTVGLALKLHQRAWALEQGIDLVTWTFDPLIRRNAWFNLTKLGARPVRYLEDFYGSMPDVINVGDASDRLYLRWPLTDPAVVAACGGEPPGGETAATLRAEGFTELVEVDPDGAAASPGDLAERVDAARHGGPGLLIPTPPDVESLRRDDLAAALTWRHAVRAAFAVAFDRGLAVTGFSRDGWYVLTSDAAPQEDG